jgi:hypothetical protein
MVKTVVGMGVRLGLRRSGARGKRADRFHFRPCGTVNFYATSAFSKFGAVAKW